MAYFAMLSGQGWTAIAGCRQFFYTRYADWVVTTTLMVVLLGQVANASNDVIFGAAGSNREFPPGPPQTLSSRETSAWFCGLKCLTDENHVCSGVRPCRLHGLRVRCDHR
jgi:hypothetical protein